MTPDEAIRWARQAGIKLPDGPFPARGSFALPELLDFARMACEAGAIAEREACAKVCEDMDLHNNELRPEYQRGLLNAARAIRARGQA